MRILVTTASIGICLMGLQPGTESAAQTRSCNLQAIARLDMTTDPSGRVSVPMTINGQTVNLMIDTGGGLSTLTRSTVATLHLSPQVSYSIRGMYYGGEIIDHYVIIENAQFAGQAMPEMKFFVTRDNSVGNADEGGTLSPDIMRWFDADFDFANSKFTLFSQDHCEGLVNYWTRLIPARVKLKYAALDHLVVPLKLDGREIDATIDSGAPETTGSLDSIERMFGIDASDKNLKLTEGSGERAHAYTYPFKELSFEGVSVQNPDFVLRPDRESRTRGVFLIGMNVLRHLHMYVAYKERVLYITPATAH